MKEKFLISIVGPTAIGKTSLSIKLAKHFKTEILSADSRQFFKELSIGTAVPSPSELASAKHHFIHHKSIEEDYNVGAFEKDALQLLEVLFLHNDIVIMVGGSGLYNDAVVEGLDDLPKVEPSIRTLLNTQLEIDGLQCLQEQLKQLDVKSFETLATDNPHRVIRALEICLGTGLPYSSFLNKEKAQRNFHTISIGLTAERPIIYNRIDTRVDTMMASGLLEEATFLTSKQHLNALNTVGYKELFKYLNGEWTLEFAVSEIKKNSRRFAKRQLTWFKKKKDIVWFDYETDFKTIINSIEEKLRFSKKD